MSSKLSQIITKNFFRPAWYSILINPIFIARQGLYKKIRAFAQADFSNKKMLDVGCGIKPYRELFVGLADYVGIDIKGGGHFDEFKEVDKFYDGQTIPFADNFFDFTICTQVLEHVADPENLLREISRTLKPGGQVFLTMPFVWNEHEIPYDFNRFTRYEHALAFKQAGLTIKSISPTCGVFGVCGQLISGFIIEKLSLKNGLFNSLIALLLCFPVQAFFMFLDLIFKNQWITLDYVLLAEKLAVPV